MDAHLDSGKLSLWNARNIVDIKAYDARSYASSKRTNLLGLRALLRPQSPIAYTRDLSVNTHLDQTRLFQRNKHFQGKEEDLQQNVTLTQPQG